MTTWKELLNESPQTVRQAIREKRYNGHTSGLATDYAQANLAILPKEYAYDFLLFAKEILKLVRF